jgi:4a-hydroxytetrahydrobiopterin dehydratase
MEYVAVTPAEFDGLDGLLDWRVVLDRITATFTASSYAAAADLVVAITAIAEEHEHHPDMEIRYPGRVHVALTTHATGGLTTLDVDVARSISAAAADLGATSDPATSKVYEIAIDTTDADRIRPFWAAVLGYREVDGDLVDPLGVGPKLWFQDLDDGRTERNRIHLDVNVAHDVADDRLAEALAAGGRLVSDEHARSWWVLADADGNEACICTWEDRSG